MSEFLKEIELTRYIIEDSEGLDNLSGYCEYASMIFAKIISLTTDKSVFLCEGVFFDDTDKVGHSWNMVDGDIIDVTANQFEVNIDYGYIQKEDYSELYKECKKMTLEEFLKYSGYTGKWLDDYIEEYLDIIYELKTNRRG